MGALPEAERSSAHLIWTLGPRRNFVGQLYSVDTPVLLWCCLGSLSYACCALGLHQLDSTVREENDQGQEAVEWTIQVQTAAFGAVLLLNVLNLGMRQHLLPFKCNLLLLFINAVAFATDLIIWRRGTPLYPLSPGLGLGLLRPGGAAAAGDRAFVPLRYVQWLHSTPTMIYMVGLLAEVRGWQLALPVLCDVAMVVTGLAACCTTGLTKGFFTAVSFATFAVVLRRIHAMFDKTLRSGDVAADQRGTLRAVRALLLALWGAFPLVWLAADWRLVSPQAEAVAWGVCDYLAKAVFSSQLWQSNLTGVHVRREVALEVWEAHNRVEAVARLSSLLEQRDELLSTLSHELRTPLAGIVALTGAVYRDVASALPASARTLGAVRAAATCMLHIVASTLDAFAGQRAERGAAGADAGAAGSSSSATASSGSNGSLAYSQALALKAPGGGAAGGAAGGSGGSGSGGGGGSVSATVVDLRPLVETVAAVLRPLAHDGVAVAAELPEGLPAVTADATRLNQVLYNLVGNALRFTSSGEVRVSARVLGPDGAVWRCREPNSSGDSGAVGFGSDSPHASAAAVRGRRSEDFTASSTSVARSPLPGGRNSGNNAPGSAGLWRRRPRTSASSEHSAAVAAPGGAGGPLGAEAAAAALPPGCVVEVAVEDTGVGISQAQLDALMAPAYRPLGAADTAAAANAAAAAGYAASASIRAGDAGDTLSDDSAARKRSNKSRRRAAKAGKAAASSSLFHTAAPAGGAISIGGTGLGLYLVRLALRAQGSELTAESAAGIGSMFRFRLPVATAACALALASKQAAQQQGQQQQQQGQQQQGQQQQGAAVAAEEQGAVNMAREASVAWMAAAGEGEGSQPGPTSAAAPAPAKVSTAPVVPRSEPSAIARLTCRVNGGAAAADGASSSSAAAGVDADGALMRYAQSCCSPLAATGSVLGDAGDSGGFPLPSGSTAAASHLGSGGPAMTGYLGRPPLERNLSCSACDGPGGLRAASGISAVMAAGAAAAAAAAAAASSAVGSVGSADGALVPGGSAPRERSSLLGYPKREVLDVRNLAGVCGGPAAVTGEAALVPAPVAAAAAPVANNFRHRNSGTLQVLSVDDDPINQLVAGQMLTSQQWKVVKCMDGPQALKFLRLPAAPEPRASASGGAAGASAAAATAADALAEALAAADAAAPPLDPVPDCVLLDVMMPGMTGFEVCRRLRRRYPHAALPVIIVSAKSDAAAVEEAFAAGADDYMTKPYKRAEMVARIKAQIRIRDSMAAAAAAVTVVGAPGGSGAARPGSVEVPPLGEDLRVQARAQDPAAAAAAEPQQPAAQSQPQPQPLPQLPHAPGSHVAGSLASLLGGAAGSDSALTPPGAYARRRSAAHASPPAAMAGGATTPCSSTSAAASALPPPGASLSGATGAFGSRMLGGSTCVTENGMQAPAPPRGVATGPAGLGSFGGGAAAAAGLFFSPGLPSGGGDRGGGIFSATSTLTGTGQFRYVEDACASELALGTTASITTGSMPPRAAALTVAFVDAESSGAGGAAAGALRAAATPAVAASPVNIRTAEGGVADLSSGKLLMLPADTASTATVSGGLTSAPVSGAAADAAAAGVSFQQQPPPTPMPLAASSPPVPPAGGAAASPAVAASPAATAAAAAAAAAVPMDLASLMAELLAEVRRSRVLEADVSKLMARVAALQTACGTLAADRDGWCRQARDLRALLASGLAAATAGIAGGGAAAPPPSLAFGGSAAAYGGSSVGGFTSLTLVGQPTSSAGPASVVVRANSLLNEAALAAANGSTASADSSNHALPAATYGGAANANGGGGGGGSVAAQLEDLRRETAALRQQLRLALASIGNGSNGVSGGGGAQGSAPPGRAGSGISGGEAAAGGGLPSTGASAGMNNSSSSSAAQMGRAYGAGAGAPAIPGTGAGSATANAANGCAAASPQPQRVVQADGNGGAPGPAMTGPVAGAAPAATSGGANAGLSAGSGLVAAPWGPHHQLLPNPLFASSTADMLLHTAGSAASASASAGSGAAPHGLASASTTVAAAAAAAGAGHAEPAGSVIATKDAVAAAIDASARTADATTAAAGAADAGLPSGDVPTPTRANGDAGSGLGARRGGGGASAHAHAQLPPAEAPAHMGVTSLSSDLPPQVRRGNAGSNGVTATAIGQGCTAGAAGADHCHGGVGCGGAAADAGILRGSGVSGQSENSRGGSTPSVPTTGSVQGGDGTPKAADRALILTGAQPLTASTPVTPAAAALAAASAVAGSGRDGARGRSGGATAGILRLLCSRGAVPVNGVDSK